MDNNVFKCQIDPQVTILLYLPTCAVKILNRIVFSIDHLQIQIQNYIVLPIYLILYLRVLDEHLLTIMIMIYKIRFDKFSVDNTSVLFAPI